MNLVVNTCGVEESVINVEASTATIVLPTPDEVYSCSLIINGGTGEASVSCSNFCYFAEVNGEDGVLSLDCQGSDYVNIPGCHGVINGGSSYMTLNCGEIYGCSDLTFNQQQAALLVLRTALFSGPPTFNSSCNDTFWQCPGLTCVPEPADCFTAQLSLSQTRVGH